LALKLQIGIDGKIYELDVEVIEEDPSPRTRGYLPADSTTPTTVQSVPVSRPSSAALFPPDGQMDEAKVCRSPVAGVVIRIGAQPGQQLQPNDLIMVLEAMKMETNVTAPFAGRVKAIKVTPGDGVKVQQVLVEFE
jgi:methylmalonyl-CoA carboxyltransferase small subunit